MYRMITTRGSLMVVGESNVNGTNVVSECAALVTVPEGKGGTLARYILTDDRRIGRVFESRA